MAEPEESDRPEQRPPDSQQRTTERARDTMRAADRSPRIGGCGTVARADHAREARAARWLRTGPLVAGGPVLRAHLLGRLVPGMVQRRFSCGRSGRTAEFWTVGRGRTAASPSIRWCWVKNCLAGAVFPVTSRTGKGVPGQYPPLVGIALGAGEPPAAEAHPAAWPARPGDRAGRDLQRQHARISARSSDDAEAGGRADLHPRQLGQRRRRRSRPNRSRRPARQRPTVPRRGRPPNWHRSSKTTTLPTEETSDARRRRHGGLRGNTDTPRLN